MAHEAEFINYVSGLIASEPRLAHEWSDDRLQIEFTKKNENGFDVKVIFGPSAQALEIETDCGYHDHFHTDKFDNFVDALDCVFGIVRDLLSRNMRIEETLSNGHPRKWRLQSYKNGQWKTEASTGLLFWNVFGKKTCVTYSNDILPPRDLSLNA